MLPPIHEKVERLVRMGFGTSMGSPRQKDQFQRLLRTVQQMEDVLEDMEAEIDRIRSTSDHEINRRPADIMDILSSSYNEQSGEDEHEE